MLSYGQYDKLRKINNLISLTNIFLFNMQCAKIHKLVHKCMSSNTVDMVIFACLDFRDFVIWELFAKSRIRENYRVR